MRIYDDIPVWGDPVEESALMQIQRCRPAAAGCALMADHHLGYSVPIGGVIAYADDISPSGVGYDIACGNKAVRLEAEGAEVRRHIATIMNDVWSALEFGIGRTNQSKVDHPLFDDPLWKLPPAADLQALARNQLGTIGSGNHYVDIFVDELDRPWVGVHFGSRGLGHKIASYFIKEGGGNEGLHADPVLLRVGRPLGDDYLALMDLAGQYAYAGRDWVCSRVAAIIGAPIAEEVHNHHNFAWREEHNGENLWVVRKGATPAFPGQRGFVGGSMGDISVILEGVDSEEARLSFRSTVHGAGRVMSRTQAAGKPGKRGIRQGGKITREMMDEWVHAQGVVLRGAGCDESPHCYKRLPEVLAHHAGSVRIIHTLQPIGVAMAGEDVFDPYKD